MSVTVVDALQVVDVDEGDDHIVSRRERRVDKCLSAFGQSSTIQQTRELVGHRHVRDGLGGCLQAALGASPGQRDHER